MKTLSFFSKTIRRSAMFLCLLPGAASQSTLAGPALYGGPQGEKGMEDKTLSPYFFVQSEYPSTDRLPLKETSAVVNIAGVIADVAITQVYKNEGRNTLEAIYVFPASTRAAVYDMKMTIGEREIFALIQEKEKARQDYEKARQEGRTASLLEQHRPNVFQMNVANILPEDVIKVELKYTELLVPEQGIYEFVYPTVVGPRYSNQAAVDAPASEGWVANPYTAEKVLPGYGFSIVASLSAGLPIQEIACPTHQVNVSYQGKSKARIELKEGESSGGNRDFILRYRLAGSKIESGLLLYEGKDENFFLAMIQPPGQVREDDIPPREYVFIVDVSGSMYGFPLEVSKKLLRDLISNLRPTDRFNMLFFAGGSNLFSESSVPATGENVSKALQMLDSQRGGGGTELLSALQRALALKGTEGYSRNFIIATDGYVTVEKEAFDLIRRNLGHANFFPFGIGSSVNRFLIEGMSHVGMGMPFIVTTEKEAEKTAGRFRKYVQHPVLTNIRVEMKDFECYEVEPLSVPDVLSERPVILYGKWRGSPSGVRPTGTILLTGKTGNREYKYTLDVAAAKPDAGNAGLKYLWARERIRLLDDYSQVDHTGDIAGEVTALGLKYNLLTRHTSFIAIDSEIRNNSGQMTTVKQPLPLPEGVSNYAVGGVSYSPAATKTMRAESRQKPSVAYDMIEYEAAEEETSENSIFVVAGVMPEFTGGRDALEKFIRTNIRWPENLKNSGITGRVFVQFTVMPDGSLADIKVIRSLHPDLDKEAVRVIGLTGKMWTPGKQAGKTVRVSMVIPVEFKVTP